MPVDCNISIFDGLGEMNPGQIKDQAKGYSSNITSDITQIRARADLLAAEAKNMITEAGQFQPREPGEVTFTPSVGGFQYRELRAPRAPALFRPENLSGGMDGIGDPPRVQIDNFQLSTINQPELSPVVFDQNVVGFTPIGTPQPPADVEINIPDAPDTDLDIDFSDLPDEGPAPIFSGMEDIETVLLDIKPYVPSALTIPDDADFERYESLVNREFQVPEYHQKMLPTLMPAVGALLAHDGFVVEIDDLLSNSQQQIPEHMARYYNPRQARLWSRRGMVTDPARDSAVQQQSAQVTSRLQQFDRDEFEVQKIRWRMKLLPMALQLVTEAHSLVMEIMGELYDLEFEFLAAKQMALIGLFEIAVAKYNKNLALLQIEAAKYRGLSAQVRSKATKYGFYTQLQQYRASLNQALGSAYEAENRTVVLRSEIFRTEASLAEISLDAYSAWVQGVTTRAQAVRARFANYEAELAAWSAEVQEVSNQHKINRLRNREVVERNKALSTQLSSDSSAAASVAYAAVQSAAEVKAEVAQARAVLANLTGENERGGYQNAEQAANYAFGIDDYRISSAEYSVETLPDRTVFSAQESANNNTARLYGEVSQTVVRAAELTQQYRTKLSDAYLAIYEATGRADAARVSGELSKYRASLGLQAAGNIGHSSQISRQVRSTKQSNKSEANQCTTSYRYDQKAPA